MTPTTFDIDLRARMIVSEGSGLPRNRVLVQNQDAKAPDEAYATVLPIARRLEGPATILSTPSTPSTDGAARGAWRATYSVQFYREGAHELAAQLALWLYSGPAQISSKRLGLTFYDTSDVRNIDAILEDDAEWEPRSSVDIEFGYLQLATAPPTFDLNDIEIVSARDDLPFGATTVTIDAPSRDVAFGVNRVRISVNGIPVGADG